ncbi:MAG: hypothetical protein GEU83_16535 [Pseudonocardiaceae bacterium]|nr:hypothetical protein [Pseudonocardiaceae bacterium]
MQFATIAAANGYWR